MLKISTALIAAIAIVVHVSPSGATATKVVKKFQDWVLYSHEGNSAKICFISAKPRERKPSNYKKKASYFYISAWPDSGVKEEISINIRNELQNGSIVTAQIGSSRYRFFTKGSKAFIEKPTEELKMIKSMKLGSFMVVRATTKDGTKIEETYSLLGITSALNLLNNSCN
ncbi:MAG: hypothetical protein TECD_01225 [Hyphomicrobiaceae bacterium hypho_1]